MNSQLDEEYGAGFEGTKELLYKYLKDTPGQKIVKYMDKTNTELEEDMVDMLIQKFKDSGRVAVRYPKKRLVSVSGRSMPEKDAIETMKRILDKEAGVKEAIEKIACLKCDEVSTAAAWQKNKGFCPVCKTSSQGVAESTELDLQTVRTMKIVSLATGCTDSEALYEYALTAPTYSSLVELKENFNRYIQDT